MQIPTQGLTLTDLPAADCDGVEIIRFVQTLNGYEETGGVQALGPYVKQLRAQSPETLSLSDLRVLLFARQRAHDHQGGGWPDGDPLMDEMRLLTEEIRLRLADRF